MNAFLWAMVSGVFCEEAAKPETIPCKNHSLAAPAEAAKRTCLLTLSAKGSQDWRVRHSPYVA
jgi:hypothetical protein